MGTGEVVTTTTPLASRTLSDLGRTRFGVPTQSGETPGDVALGRRFDRVCLLGTGAAGAVYLAHDRQLGRRVALKVIRAHVNAAPSLLAEAHAIARVQHPNVVTMLDVGELPNGCVFIAFEYVEGTSLRVHLRARPSYIEALRILRDVAAGLAAAHAVDVLHLDVKPENILVGVDGVARVLDFGIARIREGDACIDIDGDPTGTPTYMAPEVWTGEGVCDGTDVWSFAVVASEVLTGERPFKGDTALECMGRALACDGALAESLEGAVHHPPLAQLLRGALQRDRRARPYMSEIEAALRAALADPK